jgi:hypothetical protein
MRGKLFLLSTWFLLSVAAAAQISPGSLSRAHQSLEGPTQWLKVILYDASQAPNWFTHNCVPAAQSESEIEQGRSIIHRGYGADWPDVGGCNQRLLLT